MSNKLSELLTKLVEEREQIKQNCVKNNLDQPKIITSNEQLRLLNDAVVKQTAKTCFSFNNLDQTKIITSDEHLRLLNDVVVKETAKTCV